ncbi:aminotransferase class III-fold pyridoxal phosphate-dependent enzyme [bacterium]|nr:aminotransferase class III-fold pyridoxal phosphate-dependent enzyme [bacterium]
MLHNLSTDDLRALDAAHHLHPFTDHGALSLSERRVIARADGVWLWDSEGNRILDGMSGLWCVNVGHGRNEIVEAVRAQMSELAYYNTFFKTTHEPVIRLSQMVAEIAPEGMNMVFFGTSGSDANDTILRMVRTYWDLMGKPHKKTVIARHSAYHGSTMGAASLGGMAAMHSQGGLPIPGIVHVDQPYWFGSGQDMTPDQFGVHAARALENAIDAIGEEHVAAFIAEPIQGAGGVIIPPETYWPEVKRILEERGILFICDEVICGFGRTGEWFGCQTYGLTPDFMTIAKGLSSGYLPIGGVVVCDKVAKVFHERGGEFYHGYTYSGHPACCAAAIANLEIIRREKLVERVRTDIGPYLAERWLALGEHALVGEARMKGLLGALELVPDKSDTTKRFAPVGAVGTLARDFSFANGLVMRAVRDSLILSPPLTLSHEEADALIALTRKTLDDTWAELKRQGRLG